MTRFAEKRFAGPPGKTRRDECERVGCTEPDARGKCYRCGETDRIPPGTITCYDCGKRVHAATVVARRLPDPEPQYQEVCEPCFLVAERRFAEQQGTEPRPFEPRLVSSFYRGAAASCRVGQSVLTS